MELKLNGTHQLLVYADDVSLLGDNILVDTIMQNTETFIDASKKVDLEVNAEETKYMLLYHHQKGRAVTQAVSSWLPTKAVRVHVRAACGFCGGQSGIRAGFLRVLRFPLPIIPPISASS
jgi:hypothetical protein